jgi:hypothetical protein
MNTQETLQSLEREAGTIAELLSSAIQAGNGEEITYLKHRQRDLPNELFAARVLAVKDEISKLESEITADHKRLAEAKQTAKDTDALISSKVEFLKSEIAKLNQKSLSDLVEPQRITDEINRKSNRIFELKKVLSSFV